MRKAFFLWSIYRECTSILFGAAIGAFLVLLLQPKTAPEPPKKPEAVKIMGYEEYNADDLWREWRRDNVKFMLKYDGKFLLLHCTMTGEGLMLFGQYTMFRSLGTPGPGRKEGYYVRLKSLTPPVQIGEKFDVLCWLGTQDMEHQCIVFHEVQ
jgi:hypothetical protein